jgi:hypothetical protein
MNHVIRKSLIATAIAALIGSPAWAAGTASEADPSRSPQAGEQHPAVQPGAAQTEGAADSDRAMEQMAEQHPGVKATRDTELFSKSAQELEGKQVVDSSGAEIGTVQSIVSSRDKPDELYAVISPAAGASQTPQAPQAADTAPAAPPVAGAAPAAESGQVLMSLDELRWQDDKLHATGVKADLATSQKPYQADQYAEVEPADQPISEFSAFEPSPADATREGQTSPQEPAQLPQSQEPAPSQQPVPTQ